MSRHRQSILALACSSILFPALASAQRAPERPTTAPATRDAGVSPVVTRMMAFDKNGDGKLTKEEMTDSRLMNLFQDADANKDGVVTKEELAALAAKIEADMPSQGPGGRGGDGPGGRGRGPGGPPGRGRGGPGGPGGPPPPPPRPEN